LQKDLQEDCSNSLSIYQGAFDPQKAAIELKKLQVAFPSLNSDFFNLLSERIVANGFNNERLHDAIAHLIDTFPYKEPKIADIISYDRKIKLYSYNDVCSEVFKGSNFQDFDKIAKNGKLFWFKKSDNAQLNI
jgi:hypothetical protein